MTAVDDLNRAIRQIDLLMYLSLLMACIQFYGWCLVFGFLPHP
jgi:hypothetical protein